MHVNKGIQMCIQIQLLPALIIFYVSFMHDTKSFIFANCPISWYILETPSWILLPVHTTRNNYFPFCCIIVLLSVILLSCCQYAVWIVQVIYFRWNRTFLLTVHDMHLNKLHKQFLHNQLACRHIFVILIH